jgi:hypothetical protein
MRNLWIAFMWLFPLAFNLFFLYDIRKEFGKTSWAHVYLVLLSLSGFGYYVLKGIR